MINLQKASVKRRLLLKDASITVQFSLINQKEVTAFPTFKEYKFFKNSQDQISNKMRILNLIIQMSSEISVSHTAKITLQTHQQAT